MSSTMYLERTGNGGQSCGATTTMGGFAGIQPGWCLTPRCELQIEKCQGGMKINCCCDDDAACGILQNLCKMLSGGLCTICCTFNGIIIGQYNLACGACKCDYTDDGVVITCTSGDKACGKMIQACCECIGSLLESGCCGQISFNNTAVCCGRC